MVIDFFNSFQLTGSCLLHAALSRLRHLTLTGTAISDDILNRILHACSNELMELHLAGTRLSDQCLPCIVALKKLKYISVPREDAHGFGKRAALEIVQRCPTLRTFDCQEGYLFDGKEISAYSVRFYCRWEPNTYYRKPREPNPPLRLWNRRFTRLCAEDEVFEDQFGNLLEWESYTMNLRWKNLV